MLSKHTSLQAFSRTQIYLTQEQQMELDRLAKQNDCSKSELIRSAVDQFIAQQTQALAASQALQAKGIKLLAGMWAGRSDMANPTDYIRQQRQARF